MRDSQQLTYQQIVVVDGRNQLVSAKLASPLSLPQSVGLMEKLLQQFQSLVRLNALVVNLDGFMQQLLLQLLSALQSI
jgi:hypothetical protein